MNRPLVAALLAVWAVVAVASPALAATVFAPPRDGLRVKIDSFITDAFPVVEALVTLDAPEKLDFRALTADTVGLIEEEVPVRDLKVIPFSPPLSLALVLDDSGSLEKDLTRLKESVDRFVDELADTDEAAVVSFHRGVEVLQPVTYSKPALRRALGTLTAYGATALFDGIVAGVGQIRRSSGKRTLVVVSDGSDQVYPGGRALSRQNLPQAIDLARAAGVEIYAIGVGRRVDKTVLEELARRTGGFFWHAPDPRYLRPVFDAMTRSFQSRIKVIWESPKAVVDRRDRTVLIDVRFKNYAGRGISTYWLEHQPPTAAVEVVRKDAGDAGLGRLRLFTWGVDRTPLELEFFLYDQRGLLVRHGFTTEDGFGRLERSHAPQLTDVPPGHYRLVLRREGTELDFDHPDVHLAPSKTLTLSLGFSKLVFRREGKPWFDLRHDYGETSDLVEVRIEDLTRGKQIYQGRLVDFRSNRETAAWLQEGAYRVILDNKWQVAAGQQRQAAVLRNVLESEIHVLGGRQLTYDTKREDFLLPDDVTSREYQLATAEESPFKGPRPATRDELAARAVQQARRYRQDSFSTYRDASKDSDALYPYLGAASLDGRVDELGQERMPERVRRERERQRKERQDRFVEPFANPVLNETWPDINARKGPPRRVPPPPGLTDDPGAEAMLTPSEPDPVLRTEDPTLATVEELEAMEQALETPRIDPTTPSRAEELRRLARQATMPAPSRRSAASPSSHAAPAPSGGSAPRTRASELLEELRSRRTAESAESAESVDDGAPAPSAAPSAVNSLVSDVRKSLEGL